MSFKAFFPPVVLFTSVAALAIAVVVQALGALPVAFQAPSRVGLSQTTLRLSPGLQILAAEPMGTSQLAVRMTPFTSIDQASQLGDRYGMGLVGASPAFGRYVFSLPQIVVEQGSTRDTATVYFPPRATPAQITGYLTANRLTVRRWYRPDVGVEDQGRIARVSLPRITPVLVDATAGIWKALIPANLDAATLASWAAGAAIHFVGPATVIEGVSTDYTVTLANNGPDTATSVSFGGASQSPAGAVNLSTVASSSAPGVSCSGFTCTAASLAAGNSLTMILSLIFSLTTPNVAGSDTVTVSGRSQTFDPNTANNSASLLITVIPRVVATGTAVSTIEGATFSGQVASFTASEPTAPASAFGATINWGDGTATSAGTIAGGAGVFTVSGSHAYAEEGNYTISVVITAGSQTAVAGSTATVADAALTASGVGIAATEGAPFNGAVATFTDADPNGVASDYVATIAWGDGTTSTGTAATNGSGGFTVTGSHSYAEEGSYTVSVQINDAGTG